MSYSVSISGHTDDTAAELAAVDTLKAAVKELPGVSAAHFSGPTGSCSLLEQDAATDDTEPAADEAS